MDSIPSTRSVRQYFEEFHEPLGPARFKIAEADGTVYGFDPIGKVIEAEINKRLSEPTADRLGAPLLLLDITRTRPSFVGVEARQELVDRA